MRVVAGIILFAVLYFIANSLVNGFTEGKDIPKLGRIVLKAIVIVCMIILLAILSRCGCTFDEQYSIGGKSSLEHYEPRY